MYDFDLLCIGCGPAGEKAATRAAWYDKRVAIVERETKPGGAMVNTAKVPSKALRETARVCSALNRQPFPGIDFRLDHTMSVPRFMARRLMIEQQELVLSRQSTDEAPHTLPARSFAMANFKLGRTYSRSQISQILGGSTVSYLPTREAEVLCGCFKPDNRWNPGAPQQVLFGPGPRVERAAELAASQSSPIPIFLFRGSAAWEYVGLYRCTALRTSHDIRQHLQRKYPERGEIAGVLSFEQVRSAA